jgi:hypothetical protein
MLDLNVVSDFVYANFTGVKESKNGTHFLAHCVLCGDSKKNKTKKRFNLDYKDGYPIWHCFNCAESGSFLEIYCLLTGVTIDEAKKELFGYSPEEIKKRLENKRRKRPERKVEFEYHDYIRDDCVSKNMKIESIFYDQWIAVLDDFIKERKVPDDYEIMFAYKGEYKNRIIIPIYDEQGHIIYFQGRRIKGTEELDSRKYKNPTIQKSGIILNKHLFDKERFIIVTEGLLDAITIGRQGTACLGKSISDDFLSDILPLTDKGVIVLLDNDKPAYQALKKFMLGSDSSKYNKTVKYFIYPNKYIHCDDINTIVMSYSINDIYGFVIDNSSSYTTAVTRLKLGGKM